MLNERRQCSQSPETRRDRTLNALPMLSLERVNIYLGITMTDFVQKHCNGRCNNEKLCDHIWTLSITSLIANQKIKINNYGTKPHAQESWYNYIVSM
jgi:hypothetical protein